MKIALEQSQNENEKLNQSQLKSIEGDSRYQYMKKALEQSQNESYQLQQSQSYNKIALEQSQNENKSLKEDLKELRTHNPLRDEVLKRDETIEKLTVATKEVEINQVKMLKEINEI